jgi:hypothetical protein
VEGITKEASNAGPAWWQGSDVWFCAEQALLPVYRKVIFKGALRSAGAGRGDKGLCGASF